MNDKTSKNMKYDTDTIYYSMKYHSHLQIHMYTCNIFSKIQYYECNICCRHKNMTQETT